jgi:aspartyl-tRNA(Asn)/glutamyl-tRNA(Gln) amidotransferase subunit A
VDVEGSAAFENLIRSERLDLLVDPAQRGGLLAGLSIPGTDYLRAMRIRTLAAPRALELFDHFDALIAPTLLHVAPPADEPLSKTFGHMGGNGAVGNLLGWPSISVPMGSGEDDLPLGLEIIGPPYDELTILSIAVAFQRETDHHRRRPPA